MTENAQKMGCGLIYLAVCFSNRVRSLVNASASSIIWKQLGKTLSGSCEKIIIPHLDLWPCDLYPPGVGPSVLSRLVSPCVVSGVMATLSESVVIDIKIWKIRVIYYIGYI